MFDFDAAYAQYHRQVRTYVRNLMGSSQDAEELTQDVFLKAYLARDSYDPQYSVSTWLYSIARNTVTDRFRYFGRRFTQPVEDYELMCPRPTAEDVSHDASTRRRLHLRLRRLTPRQRRVVFLRVGRGMGFTEIAARMSTNLSTVKNLYLRAQKKLAVQSLRR